jgi:hypothetical protein
MPVSKNYHLNHHLYLSKDFLRQHPSAGEFFSIRLEWVSPGQATRKINLLEIHVPQGGNWGGFGYTVREKT